MKGCHQEILGRIRHKTRTVFRNDGCCSEIIDTQDIRRIPASQFYD